MSDRKYKKSKEEIAKQFQLPERKSKIATMLNNTTEQYCICRSSDSSRFMIACDNCEEWYHGDCINITEKEAKHIKSYFCLGCREANPELQTVFRMTSSVPSVSTSVPREAKDHVEKRPKKRKEKPSKSSGSTKQSCGKCEGCRMPKCGKCKSCIEYKRSGWKQRCDMRVCVGSQTQVGRPKRRRRSLTPENTINPALEGLRQCHGPQCINAARSQSKYCSDECGIKLATSRIYQVLPQRIQEWSLTPSKAEEANRKMLDSIRAKQVIVRATLQELDTRHRELDLLVERAKRCVIDPKAAENNDNEDESSMYCITCGHEIHSRFAIRHMEKCFNKYESQASFGSIFKTRIEGNSMFCDFFNPASGTYCKRLKVLCPEHSKDPKISDTDVCGCPLVRDVFDLTGEFCRAPKKSCYKHYVWEKIRRAEIDLERVRQWLKMDELIEQERQVRTAMASRASVMGLILHSSYNHDIMNKLIKSGTLHR